MSTLNEFSSVYRIANVPTLKSGNIDTRLFTLLVNNNLDTNGKLEWHITNPLTNLIADEVNRLDEDLLFV